MCEIIYSHENRTISNFSQSYFKTHLNFGIKPLVALRANYEKRYNPNQTS